MKALLAALLPLAPMMTACGGNTPDALPADPIQRAAACGAVAAAQARTGLAVTADMPVAGQGATLRPALLAGSAGGSFDTAATAAVVDALPAAGKDLDEKRVATLAPLCAQAFPLPAGPVALPSDPLTTALGCDELGEFMRRALESQPDGYAAETARYFALNRALDAAIAPLFARRGIRAVDAQQAEAKKAMAAIVKTGEPSAVLDACSARFVDR